MRFRLCLFIFSVLQANVFAQQHPGGMHPKSQVDFVKHQISLGNEPYNTAFKQLLLKADSALLSESHALADFSVPGYYVKPAEHRKNSLSLQTDAFSAYACALAWQLNGKKVYAEKAIDILNAWASLNAGYSDSDGPLVMSYSGTAMVIAGELMRTYKKWKKENQLQFSGWVQNVYRKACNEIRHRKNNWADWGRYGSILSDYYLDDTTDMAENIRLIKSDLFDKIAEDGHMPEEVRREANGIWYTYFSLAPITAACWVVYNATGENIFTLEQNGRSIKKAIDYMLYYDQHPAEWTWFKGPNTAKPGSATGYWPANLVEAMYGVYGENSYKVFTESARPVIYDKHHFAWTFPTLMPLKIDK